MRFLAKNDAVDLGLLMGFGFQVIVSAVSSQWTLSRKGPGDINSLWGMKKWGLTRLVLES